MSCSDTDDTFPIHFTSFPPLFCYFPALSRYLSSTFLLLFCYFSSTFLIIVRYFSATIPILFHYFTATFLRLSQNFCLLVVFGSFLVLVGICWCILVLLHSCHISKRGNTEEMRGHKRGIFAELIKGKSKGPLIIFTYNTKLKSIYHTTIKK